MEGRMCSLFIIVYLIETSLWVQDLVPALCPNTEGEMASSIPFWKLSSCQSGSDIFTMLPWAHLLCPHPSPRHCKPPLIPQHSLPALLALQQARQQHQSQIHMWPTDERQVTDPLSFLFFSYNHTLPLSVVLSVLTQTQNWPKNWTCLHAAPHIGNDIISQDSLFPNVITQMWFSVNLSDPEVKYAASGCFPHLPIFFSQRDVYFGNPILF